MYRTTCNRCCVRLAADRRWLVLVTLLKVNCSPAKMCTAICTTRCLGQTRFVHQYILIFRLLMLLYLVSWRMLLSFAATMFCNTLIIRSRELRIRPPLQFLYCNHSNDCWCLLSMHRIPQIRYINDVLNGQYCRI